MASQNYKLQHPNRKTNLLNQKMKTIESIGTFNETPVNFNQFDQSIVCKREVFVQNPFLFEDHMTASQCTKMETTQNNNEKASRVENEVGEIARMKMLFESRVNNQKQNASRIQNKSMDKSPNARSIEKHILKPTHTPSFNKFEPKKIGISHIEQKPIMSLKFSNNQSLVNEQQNHEKKQFLCPQSSSKKSAMECSEISSKFEEYQFGYDFNQISAESRISNENQHQVVKKLMNEMNRQSSPKKIDFSELKAVNPSQSQALQSKHQQKCSCEATLSQFMQQTSCKLAELTERLMYLEQENTRLRQLEEKFNQHSESLKVYQQQNEMISNECNQLRESNYTHQAEKQELETLLKEILFKREKEKFQRSSTTSKENTYRNEDDSCLNRRGTLKADRRNLQENFYRGENQEEDYVQEMNNYEKPKDAIFKKESTSNSRKIIQPLGLRASNVQQNDEISDQKFRKEGDSKMKVQNLLSKLQIKIQKS